MLARDICTRTQFNLPSNIIPRLRHAGLTQQELDSIFIATPQRLLTLEDD